MLNIIGKVIDGSEWGSFVREVGITPITQGYPNGYGIASFMGCGTQVFFERGRVSSIALYGGEIEYVAEIGKCQSLLPFEVKFGQPLSETNLTLGPAFQSRSECPPDSKEASIKAYFYKVGDFGIIARFDKRSNDRLTYVEYMSIDDAQSAAFADPGL